MFDSIRKHFALAITAALLFTMSAVAEDWPSYRHDVARSGVTKETLKPPLWGDWTFVPLHPPAPAWGDPQPKPVEGNLELPRMKFDDAFHVAVADGLVYFGSSSDNTVYCLDAATGEIKWTYVTGGPVRLAPMVSDGKVFFGSDDGYVYCLGAKNGREFWKFRAGPSDERVVGQGHVISLWPIRTGVLVDESTAYFGAGVFPYETLYLYAVRAKDGRQVWVNDDYGKARQSAISPQGYLLASSTKLFMPAGRCPPAAFSRDRGDFLFQGRGNWRMDGLSGGTYALLTEDKLYSGTEQIVAYDQNKGKTGFAWFHGRQLIVTRKVSYMVTDTEMSALDRTTFPAASRERQNLRHKRVALQEQERALKTALKAALRKAEKTPKETGKTRRSRKSSRKKQRRSKKEKGRKEPEPAGDIESLQRQLEEVKRQLDSLAEAEKRVAKVIEGTKKWRIECDCPDSLILAGGTLYAGGPDHVIAVDAETGKKLWTGKVDGRARGLAVAGGRLFVSTDKGNIHCLTTKRKAERKKVQPGKRSSPYPQDDLTSFYETTAKLIAKDAGVKKGYCLVIGAETGRLAYELARKTDWLIYGLEKDEQKVKKARTALSAAGLYGARVCMDQGSLDSLPYPDYFANVVVCEGSFRSGKLPTPAGELLRVLRPVGGVAFVGEPGSARRSRSLSSTSLKKWLKALDDANVQVAMKGNTWAKITRGRLKGAGSWTHQYAEPGNTACSDDQLVKCPLGILWFGNPGPGRMPSRHASGAGPLSMDGRLFVEGENIIMAYDAYNGTHLWDREIQGAMRLGLKQECSNLALSKDGLFVAVNDTCLRLDPETGETEKTYRLPSSGGRRRKWGYVACVGDTLFGSTTSSHQRSDTFFALDVKTGRTRWTHRGEVMLHTSMAVGGGKVFLIESSVSDERRKSFKASPGAIVRCVMALDAKNGKVLWQKLVDLTDCVKVGSGGGEVMVIYKSDVLLLCMTPWNGHFNEEFKAGKFSRRSIIALSAKDGKDLWSGHLGYRSRPLVVGDTLYAEPWAYDLRTGKPRMNRGKKWEMFRPGHHCGCMAAAPHLLMFRSYTLAFYDLIKKNAITNFGGLRPGCWINFIAANGLMLVPEASSGCVCPFPIQCTVVLHHRSKDVKRER